MALSFDELRQLFIDKLLSSIKIPADELNNLVDELLTTCEFQLDDLTESFKGLAETTDDPGTPTNRVFYLADGPGTYTNFGGLVVTMNLAFLIYNGSSWEKSEQNIDMANYYTKTEIDNILSGTSVNYTGTSKTVTHNKGRLVDVTVLKQSDGKNITNSVEIIHDTTNFNFFIVNLSISLAITIIYK